MQESNRPRIRAKCPLGGKTWVISKTFGNEGTGIKTMVDYPWVIGKRQRIVIRGNSHSENFTHWCVTAGVTTPGRKEVFFLRLCRESPEEPLKQHGFSVFIEDWLAPSCSSDRSSSSELMNFKVQRAAIFSNWKAFVNGKEVETGVPRFRVDTRVAEVGALAVTTKYP